MSELSPAAQAVLDAAIRVAESPDAEAIAAAALRAAADQVVPLCSTKFDRGMQRMMIRNDFLVIATELESQ